MKIRLGRLFAASFLCTLPYFLFYGNVQIPEKFVRRSILNHKFFFQSEWFLDERLKPQKLIYSPVEDYCNGLDFIVAVHTKFSDSATRRMWRSTYGTLQQKYNFKIFFPVGLGSHNPPLANESLEFEHNYYGDILQHEYQDAYRNLTYKHVALLRFFVDHCSSNTTLLKLDDDVVWKVENVSNFIKKFQKDKNSTLSCHGFTNWPVHRSGKWKISTKEYPNKTYPEFCGGLAYFMTKRMAEALLAQLPNMNFFWIDDAYLTGIVRNATGIKLKKINGVISTDGGKVKAHFSGNKTMLNLINKKNMEEIFKMFN